jgi:acyl-CoA thioesterase I
VVAVSEPSAREFLSSMLDLPEHWPAYSGSCRHRLPLAAGGDLRAWYGFCTDLNQRQRRILAVSTRSRTGNTARWVGPWGIALIIVAPLTLVLVVFTLLHAPSPPVTTTVPLGSQTAIQLPARPSPTPSASATPRPLLVAFLGDSYAFGHGASGPSKRWVNLVSLNKGWSEANLSQEATNYSTAGEPGFTSYRARLSAVVATGAQIVVVSGGRSDVGVDSAQFRSDVRATFAGIHGGLPKARLIVVSPTWGNDPAPARLIALISIVKDEAQRAGATYLDIGEPLFGHSSMMDVDGWHPNDAGHAAIAAAVEKALG